MPMPRPIAVGLDDTLASSKAHLGRSSTETILGRSGGPTTVDITRRGIGTAYGIQRLIEQARIPVRDILFAGDQTDAAGNGHPVRGLGLARVRVQNRTQTRDVVEDPLGRRSTLVGES